MENNDHQKDTKLRRGRTQDSGIPRTVKGQTTEYVHKTQRLVNDDSDKVMDNVNS